MEPLHPVGQVGRQFGPLPFHFLRDRLDRQPVAWLGVEQGRQAGFDLPGAPGAGEVRRQAGLDPIRSFRDDGRTWPAGHDLPARPEAQPKRQDEQQRQEAARRPSY
ncbi:hypothetical protein [Rhodovulum sp. ES.010]|uniref:hypothetical protein n=1 Tax=Rhodovulum sp. ES.010 TaxID=1882821 RepID=UPI0009FA9EF1|nr:hypothetical protein [Rhodovulum sp. ES.010]